ncbi:MAG: ArsA family ATPase [Thermoplasmatota archaeon]
MHALADRRLLIFAGKGGVGKTTTSAATAIALAKMGRKTLLVTVDPAKRLADSLGMDIGFDETPIQPNLSAMMLDPGSVIKEHFERELPQLRVTEHPMFKYVTDYLPGLNELMAIGKLNDVRREGKYDVIVIDTAPTGHALSFLGVPKAMKELMSEKSLLKWAVRGYTVWQKVSGAAKNVGNVFKKKEDRKNAPPDIDFERLFADIQKEAETIQTFLGDPKHSGLVLVTLPEKLPVEETFDLHEAVTTGLGMEVAHIVINKVQPDALAGVQDEFDALAEAGVRKAFVTKAAKATGQSAALLDAMLEATAFSEVRREMNLSYIAHLQQGLPDVPVVQVPLFKQDVNGLQRLGAYSEALFA